MSRPVVALALAVLSFPLAAQEAGESVSFDRPGIGFSTSTLPAGTLVWEQGLPSISQTRQDGVRSRELSADSLVRIGLARGLELQLGNSPWVRQDVRAGGVRQRSEGAGDSHLSLKFAPALASDHTTLALMATTTRPTGNAAVRGEASHDIGITVERSLGDSQSLALYLDGSWGDGGTGWLFSPSFNLDLNDRTAMYVEAGIGTGSQHMRALGTGITWMASPRVQLDASVLRGLDTATPDWQGGLGIAFLLR